jgi:hypothetical protein
MLDVNCLDLIRKKFYKAKNHIQKAEKELNDLKSLTVLNKTPVFKAKIIKEDFILSF